MSEVNTEVLVARLARIRDLPFVAAVDYLCRDHELDPDGGYSLALAKDLNIIIDSGLSDDALDAGRAILDDDRLRLRPLTTTIEVLVVYGFDRSRMVGLPLVGRPPKGGYRKPHWLPSLVVLR